MIKIWKQNYLHNILFFLHFQHHTYYHNIVIRISAYFHDFWRSRDTEDWSNDAENSALITEINYILQYINTLNSYFKL